MNYSLNILNNQPQLSIPIGNLRVYPYTIEQLLEVKIQQKINGHSTFYLKGLMSNTGKKGDTEVSDEGTNVSLSAVAASGEEFILFQGVAQDVKIQVEQDVHILEIQAVSNSYLLDVEKKSRSFQNKKRAYTDLIQQITSGYPGADVIDVASNGVPTNQFIIQHMETDWEFLKRLASHFNTGLVCDVRFDTPKYFFGVPHMQALELANNNYTVKKDMQKFNLLSQNGVGGLGEQDFIYYEVETNCVARIGDQVSFQQKQLYVSDITSLAENGLFVSRLVLVPQKGLSQLYQPNNNIVGASFSGRILESKNDQVKVNLDIDRGLDPGDPCFFLYSTIYSSQDGSGWYCMPETGDTVRIYCPDGQDDHAYAISSVHEQVDPALQHQKPDGAGGASGGGYSGQRDDPSVKSLTNSAGMEVRLTPDGVYIISDGATITMTAEGIEMFSENDIVFKSEKNIYMSAEQEVSIVGTSEIGLCSESATVLMTDNVEIVGQEVKAN